MQNTVKTWAEAYLEPSPRDLAVFAVIDRVGIVNFERPPCQVTRPQEALGLRWFLHDSTKFRWTNPLGYSAGGHGPIENGATIWFNIVHR